MIMEQWWNVADMGKAEVLGENMGQCHCFHVERPAGRMTGRQLTAGGWGGGELPLKIYASYV
jgi:hypothetical protein